MCRCNNTVFESSQYLLSNDRLRSVGGNVNLGLVSSLHFRVFICQVFVGSSIHGCTSLNLILDRNSLVHIWISHLQVSFLWKVMSFVRNHWIHFRCQAPSSLCPVSTNQCDTPNLEWYPGYTQYMQLLEIILNSLFSKLWSSHFFSSNDLSELGLGDSLKTKSLLLILGTSIAHPLFSLSTNLWSCSV